MQGQRSARHLIFIMSALLMAMFMVSACGGGSSSDGEATVSLSGTVLNPMTAEGVGGALVGAYRFDDHTLIDSTTSAATGGTGTFTLTGLPKDIRIYLKAGKTGYVSGNTQAATLSADATGALIAILPEDSAVVDIANELYSKDESSWNDTLQGAGYLVMDAEDPIDDDLEGLTVTGGHTATVSMLTILYADNSTGTYITSAPTVARADSIDGLPMMGAVVGSGGNFGGYALSGSLSEGILEDSGIMAPIIQGEFTYFVWYGDYM